MMISKARIRKNNRGLSLVEVLMAISILSIGIVGILRAYAKALESLQVGKENADLICLIKEKMGDIEQGVIESKGFTLKNSSGSFNDDFSDFSWELKRDSEANSLLNEIILSVTNVNSKRNFSVATYFRAPAQKAD